SAGRLQDADRCRVRASQVPGGAAAMAAAANTARPTLTVTPNVPAEASAAAAPPELEVERSHMTSLTDSAVNTPAPMDIERTPPTPVYEAAPPAADINHSMEIAPARDAETVGPPALETRVEEAAPVEKIAPVEKAAPPPAPRIAAPVPVAKPDPAEAAPVAKD